MGNADSAAGSDPLPEATRRLTNPVTVLRTTVSGRDVSVVYEVGGETFTESVLIDEERDDRGSFDYAWYRGDDIEDAYVVEAIEAAALAAYDREAEALRSGPGRRTSKRDHAATVPIPFMSIRDTAEQWFRDLADSTGGVR